jgi:hypothetical protein
VKKAVGILALLVAMTQLVACGGPTPAPPPDHRLVAYAVLPAASFVDGPTSGQFAGSANGVSVPFEAQQPAQGVSALLPETSGRFLAMSDNGFGTQENSPDYVLTVYRFVPSLKTAAGGEATIGFETAMTLRDREDKIGFPIVAEQETYRADSEIPVDEAIKEGRLITGADLDIESFRRMSDGTFWFGDEFGPFLIYTDASGVLLRPPVPLPGVKSPQSPLLGNDQPNAQASGGFEAMAQSIDGSRLYPMLEKPLEGAPEGELNIYEFDPMSGVYVSEEPVRKYRLSPEAMAASEFVALSENTFLVLERDAEQGADALHKKIFLVDFGVTDVDGYLLKREVVDLLRIPDPNDIGGFGETFSFPFVTIESIAVFDENTIAVANDNNYPFSVGRHVAAGAPDDSELILIRFQERLADLRVQ